MNNFGLNVKHQNIINQIFSGFINLNSIYIYGSRALEHSKREAMLI